MNIRACFIFSNFICSIGIVQGQNIQNNNQGVIVNQVLVVPAYPAKTSADYIQDYDNGRAASEARGAAAGEEYLRNAGNRTMERAEREKVGAVLSEMVTYRVIEKASRVHSGTFFEQSDGLSWDLPVGTRFWLLTTAGPSGHAAIHVLDFQLQIPASFNGFSHTPENRTMGYVDLNTLRYEKTSFSGK